MTYHIQWTSVAIDQVAMLTKIYPEAGRLITEAAYELADNPTPSNSVQLGTSKYRKLLLGFYRVTYEVQDELVTVQIVTVGRAEQPR